MSVTSFSMSVGRFLNTYYWRKQDRDEGHMYTLSNVQNMSCFDLIPVSTALPLTQKLCSVLKWISVLCAQAP